MSEVSESAQPRGPRYPIESVANAARILELFVETAELRLTDVAERLGVSPSTAHRLLTTLESRGLVAQNEVTRCYLPGAGLGRIAQALVPEVSGFTTARPYLADLAERVGETVNLLLRHGTEVSFADSVESSSSVRVGSRLGAVMPAHTTSGGKILLAALPEDEIGDLYPEPVIKHPLAGDAVDRQALVTQLQQARRRGYASNFGQSEPGISGLAVRVQTATLGDFALAVAVPAARITGPRTKALVERLRMTAGALHRAFAG